MTHSDPIIKFDKVVKRFGALMVLNELDFEVRRGEKVSIIGPSGSGKSTVLRILITLEGIEGGLVTVRRTALARTGARWAQTRQPSAFAQDACAARHGVSAVQSLPAHDRAAQYHRGTGHCAGSEQAGG